MNPRKRRVSSRNREPENENQAPKKRKTKPADGIAKSQQLIKELQNTRSNRASTNRRNATRICGNGRLMPSLAELERLYDDSDDDQLTTSTSTGLQFERPKTPENKPTTKEQNIFSPCTIKKIATNMVNMLDKLVEVPPIVPPKKLKKPDEPYIVGCKDREQKEWNPKTSFCKGEKKYGVNGNPQPSEEGSPPNKLLQRSSHVNISKSIFNARSDEIAARLQQSDCKESAGNDSPDSNQTVDYDCNRSFSPVPSTSRDNETFLQNDLRFNKSIQSENCFGDSSQNDVEFIETPCEIIEIDDTFPLPVSNAESVQSDDDCCIIVTTADTYQTTSPIRIDSPTRDEFYGSLNLSHNYDNDVCGIIDVDDVIAQNKVMIERYSRNNNLDTVTLVEPRHSGNSRNESDILQAENIRNPENTINATLTALESTRNIPVMNTVDRQNASHNLISNDNTHSHFVVTSVTSVPANQPPKTTDEQSIPPLCCPICWDSLSDKPAASTFCGHIFCMACIKSSIKASGKKCPTCRKALKGGMGYHPLFL